MFWKEWCGGKESHPALLACFLINVAVWDINNFTYDLWRTRDSLKVACLGGFMMEMFCENGFWLLLKSTHRKIPPYLLKGFHSIYLKSAIIDFECASFPSAPFAITQPRNQILAFHWLEHISSQWNTNNQIKCPFNKQVYFLNWITEVNERPVMPSLIEMDWFGVRALFLFG